jgi:hypothetical protein
VRLLLLLRLLLPPTAGTKVHTDDAQVVAQLSKGCTTHQVESLLRVTEWLLLRLLGKCVSPGGSTALSALKLARTDCLTSPRLIAASAPAPEPVAAASRDAVAAVAGCTPLK